MENIEIPQLQPLNNDDWYACYEDPMLTYIIEVADKFWLGWDGEDFQLSDYPHHFVQRMANGKIELRNEWWQNYLQAKKLQQSLDLFGIDTIEKKAQFFYLCLMVKDYAISKTNDAVKVQLSPRERIQKFIDALDYLKPNKPNEGSDYIFGCEGTGKLEYIYKKEKVQKKKMNKEYETHFIIDDAETLAYIQIGLQQFLDNNRGVLNSPLDACHLGDFNKRVSSGVKHLLFLFHKYICWFLMQQKKVEGRYGDGDRWLIVSRMVYYIGISNDTRFLEKPEESSKTTNLKPTLGKDGNYKKRYPVKAKYLKGLISKVKEEDIKTTSFVYWN